MEPYTLDRNFLRQDLVGPFSSFIWTERYYGDSETELVVVPSLENVQKLRVGTFLGLDSTDEVMILETANIEEGKLKLNGISLMSWMNNRFVRTTASPEEKSWNLSGMPAGQVLWEIVDQMCVEGSPYLDGTIDTGIPDPERLVVPGLDLLDFDVAGDDITVAVPFGPVYNAMKDIATANEVGIQILLLSASDSGYVLGFRSYRGLDRTSGQMDYPVVRFSPQMESFAGIKELQSIKDFKTVVYAFAENNPDGLATAPGVADLADPQYVGFDLRAEQLLVTDITSETIAGSGSTLLQLLNTKASDELKKNKFVKAVDGEIVPTSQFQYGIHYNLGDVIEVQGNSGTIQRARITEHIRSQDSTGEKAYPTVTMID